MVRAETPIPFKRTGAIWRKPRLLRSRTVKKACTALRKTYGTPRFGNPADPLDDLIFITLSNKTTPRTARNTYRRLRARFEEWDLVLSASPARLRCLLKPAGLSAIKSRFIRGTLRAVKKDFGVCDLSPLRKFTPGATQKYLVGLPGVSEKVAKCVMMYTLHFRVLPVDTHVHRISSRLGWTGRRRADQCHTELEALVPPALRHNFHVACIAHGRKICRPRNPLCTECCIQRYCQFFKTAR